MPEQVARGCSIGRISFDDGAGALGLADFGCSEGRNSIAVMGSPQGSEGSPAWIENFWRRLFPGEIPDRLLVAEPLEGNALELEGRKLVAVNTGRTDTAHSTCLHVPSIGLIVGGDVVYNGIHPYLGETDTQSWIEWISTLDIQQFGEGGPCSPLLLPTRAREALMMAGAGGAMRATGWRATAIRFQQFGEGALYVGLLSRICGWPGCGSLSLGERGRRFRPALRMAPAPMACRIGAAAGNFLVPRHFEVC